MVYIIRKPFKIKKNNGEIFKTVKDVLIHFLPALCLILDIHWRP